MKKTRVAEEPANFLLHYKIWMETPDGESILGDGKWQLLKVIDEEGSLMNAVNKLGISYRKTWDKLKSIEKLLGVPLLEKTRGGQGGGSSILSPYGKKIVQAFDHFHQKMDGQFKKAFEEFKSELSSGI